MLMRGQLYKCAWVQTNSSRFHQVFNALGTGATTKICAGSHILLPTSHIRTGPTSQRFRGCTPPAAPPARASLSLRAAAHTARRMPCRATMITSSDRSFFLRVPHLVDLACFQTPVHPRSAATPSRWTVTALSKKCRPRGDSSGWIKLKRRGTRRFARLVCARPDARGRAA